MMSVFRPKIQFSSFLKFLLPRHKKGPREFVPYDRVSLYRDTQFTNILFGKEIVQVLIYSGME